MTAPVMPSMRTREIRAAARAGDGRAEAMLATFLKDLFAIAPGNVTINRDQYSLNSLNGFFDTPDGAFFFKFHQEDGEETMSGEYYRADILARAGLPVEMPVLSSTLPGEQILVYRRRSDPRFSDVLRALDMVADPAGIAAAARAEHVLSGHLMEVFARTLHPITPQDSTREPIHRLFHDRLVDLPSGHYPGGRLAAFYVGKRFAFPGAEVDWPTLATSRVRINGILYRDTIGGLFDAARQRLEPTRLADAGGVVAHGDAHNANVWYVAGRDGPELRFFDPAFAGEHVPTLLAEVKSTFHNILAHPVWLYEPDEAQKRYAARVRHNGDIIDIETDFAPSPVRQALLAVKRDALWRPLLALLAAQGLLPDDWRQVIRLAAFLCPTLVMNLRAGAASHNPTSSAIAIAVAVMAGSEPEAGARDLMSDFLDAIAP